MIKVNNILHLLCTFFLSLYVFPAATVATINTITFIRHLVCIGVDDNSAFYVAINNKSTFPSKDPDVTDATTRCNLKKNDRIKLYWTLGKTKQIIEAVFKYYAENEVCAARMVEKLAKKLSLVISNGFASGSSILNKTNLTDTGCITKQCFYLVILYFTDPSKEIRSIESEISSNEDSNFSEIIDDEYVSVDIASKMMARSREGDALEKRANNLKIDQFDHGADKSDFFHKEFNFLKSLLVQQSQDFLKIVTGLSKEIDDVKNLLQSQQKIIVAIKNTVTVRILIFQSTLHITIFLAKKIGIFDHTTGFNFV